MVEILKIYNKFPESDNPSKEFFPKLDLATGNLSVNIYGIYSASEAKLGTRNKKTFFYCNVREK